jgi:hypothetical protein
MKWLTMSVVLALAGCGGGSAGNGGSNPPNSNPPANTSSTVQGQWTFTGTDAQNLQVAVFANLSQSGTSTFFASPSNVAVCVTPQGDNPQQAASTFGSSCGLDTVPLDGTLGANSVNIGLMNVTSVNGGTEAVNATGTFTAANNVVTTMQGTWSSSGGDVPDSGTWTAQPNLPFTGTYNGTVNFNGSMPVNVMLVLTQNTSFGITGSVTVNDPCFVGWNFSGSVVGGGFGGFNSNKSIIAGGVQTSPGEITFGYKSLSGCATAGVGVLTTSSATGQVLHASESQKALLNSVLNTLEAKSKIAEKQKEQLRKLLGKP